MSSPVSDQSDASRGFIPASKFSRCHLCTSACTIATRAVPDALTYMSFISETMQHTSNHNGLNGNIGNPSHRPQTRTPEVLDPRERHTRRGIERFQVRSSSLLLETPPICQISKPLPIPERQSGSNACSRQTEQGSKGSQARPTQDSDCDQGSDTTDRGKARR